MDGYQLALFTQQDRKHAGRPLGHWLLEFAKARGALGATLVSGAESFGSNGRLHSAHFFELGDQPVQVLVTADTQTCEQLLQGLAQEGVDVFYVKTAVQFGRTSGSPVGA
ncbi:hypothetical protein PIGHUM_02033 [Pigmentiphaga humi]|uniref:Uncharacterized protein n=1 Tax=Pigmentiphaga humi TaxID=2478468 RepID=A0A3P4B0Z3_9BURK|nr:DUF190 domain-containing protein [Pigmentiphaga humi]VCU69967.1 hypothetical protein PIGHUM_02033 [Pigmentiphaga humi]